MNPKQTYSIQLEEHAANSKSIQSTIRLDVEDGYVLLKFYTYGTGGLQIQAGYDWHHGPDFDGTLPVLGEKPGREHSSSGHGGNSETYYWRDESLANSLRWLVEDWPDGTPDFDSIDIECKKAAIDSPELDQLVLAVWLEAFGQDVPDAEGLQQQVEFVRLKQLDLRAQCFEWLQGGIEGVERWNALRVDDRKAVGNLGACQFGGLDLRGVQLGNQDLRMSDFENAHLEAARLGGADCRGVKFRGAKLSNAWLSGGKFLNADFTGATLRSASIRAADCRGAVFNHADLSDVDFSFADLRDVDLTAAHLDSAKLFRIKYDEQTLFPDDFDMDPALRMEWKGAKQRSADYRTQCSLAELTSLIPPPETPRDCDGDWAAVERELSITFPADFKQLIHEYGSGEMLSGLGIINPLTPEGRASILDELEMLADFREASQMLWPIYPEDGGLLPWGGDWHGNVFLWETNGSPSEWATGQMGHGFEEAEIDAVNITTFLFNYARNQYPEMLGGLEFTESDFRFL